MSIRTFFVRLSWKAAAVAAFAWSGSAASAADVTAPAVAAPVATAAPVSVGEVGCASCQTCAHGAVKGHCDACGKLLGSHLHKDKKAPYPVTLCPGACFGYFQTQWRKWDEVCPYPYLGMGPNAGVQSTNAPPAPGAGPRPGELGQPRPVDPKMVDPKMPDPKKTGSLNLPAIPVVPAAPAVPTAAAPNKFAR